jgi:hypothetical protein
MPLWFGNLGSMPDNEFISVSGNLYLLATGNLENAIVLDLRRYKKKSCDESPKISFQRFGNHLKLPILPKPRLREIIEEQAAQRRHHPFERILSNIMQVYVLGLSKQPSIAYGWEYLYRIFPAAKVSKVVPGKTHWKLSGEIAETQRVIRAMACVRDTEPGEKSEIDPFKIFTFRSSQEKESVSALIAGQDQGRPFSFFFGHPKFEQLFLVDRIEAFPARLHALSFGAWHSSYANSE